MTKSAIDGGTVLVTGASSGIGMAIVREIAPRAKAIVLVARRVDRLEKLKEELTKARSDLRVEVLPCDLSKREDVERLIADVNAKDLDVDVLVNNAGVGMMGFLDQAKLEQAIFTVDLNVTSLTMLTVAFLPGMVQRNRGGVLNISSGFGLSVMPMFAVYCATKHYVTGLTEALVADLGGTDVVATQVCPGPVKTEFEEVMGNETGKKVPSFVEISAEQCARESVRGFDRGRALVVPGFIMKIVMIINELSPRLTRRLVASIIGRVARKRLGGKMTSA